MTPVIQNVTDRVENEEDENIEIDVRFKDNSDTNDEKV